MQVNIQVYMHILHQVWIDEWRERNAVAACGRTDQTRGYADPNNKALLTPLSISLHRKFMYRNLCNLNKNAARGRGVGGWVGGVVCS